MAQRLRTLVAAVNGSNQALELYRGSRRMAAGSQDSALFRSAARLPWWGHHWVAERGASGDSDYLWDDPDKSDGWTGHDPGSVQVAEQGYEPESAGEFDYLTSV